MEEETTLEINLLADIVKKILQNCIETWNLKVSSGQRKYNHIDVTLSKEEARYYWIQITNYGHSTDSILQFSNNIFRGLISAGCLPKNTSLATIYLRREHNDHELIYNLRFAQKCLSLSKNTNDKEFISFSHWKEYLSFKLKYKLIFCDLAKFKEIILNEMIVLQTTSPHTKFTYHRDGKIMYNNHIPLDDDYKTCQALSVALTNIIKQSLNTEFKEKCFAMLKVDNSHQAETAIMTRLLPMVHENYTFPVESDNSLNNDII